jgi:hypothetical protein
VATNPPTPEQQKPATIDKDTFNKLLAEALADDPDPIPTRIPAVQQQPSNSNNGLTASELDAALDARDARKKAQEEQKAKDTELEELRKRPVPKKRSWFSPLFD